MKRAFTLIELLAVVVILGIILALAIPVIGNIEERSTLKVFTSTIKEVATNAESRYLSDPTYAKAGAVPCDDVGSLKPDDYTSCSILIEDGKAKVLLIGAGKFENMASCNSTKNNVNITNKCDKTITYDANGGTIGNSELFIVSKEDNETYGRLPIPSRDGYAFLGWYTNQTNGVEVSSTDTVSARVLYAHWSANSFTITFDMQGGNSGTETVAATYDSPMPNITLPTKTGYTFDGYYTSAGGSGTQYYDASGASVKNYDLRSNATLYAKWTTNTYTLTINPNGGTYNGTTSNITKTQNYNTTFNVSNNATRDGYVFNGWKLTSGTGEITWYDSSNLVKSFIANSASATKPNVYNNKSNGTVTITTVSDSTSSTGYAFKIVTNGEATPGAGGFYHGTTSVSGAWFYHEFVAKVPTGYNVTIASNSRGIGSTQYWLTSNAGTGKYEKYIYITPCGDVGAFLTFGHIYLSGTDNTSVTWYLRESKMYKISTSRATTSATTMGFKFLASNATLTAQWGTSGTRITANANGGTFASGATTAKDFANGTTYTSTKLLPYYISSSDYKISRTGYTFQGLYTAASGGTMVTSATAVGTSNVTVYAHWVQ